MVLDGIMRSTLGKHFFLPNVVCQNKRLHRNQKLIAISGSTVTFYRHNGKYNMCAFKDNVNLYFTKFAVICLSPSISPSNQHINGCFILTENWYALPMVFFLLLGTQNKMTRYHILKYLGPKACQSTCSYLFWSRNI